ncbi:MAG: CHAD domain-containing protein [Bacteroidota bacterium]
MKHPVIHTNLALAESIQHALLYYNKLAIDHLEKKTLVHYHIHETRLCCKRIRSLLRLVRPGLSPETYDRFNTFYRDQARELSIIRDFTALSETLQKFLDSTHNEKSRKFIVWFRNQLLKKRRQTAVNQEFGVVRSGIRNAFEQQSEIISGLEFDDNHTSVLGRGFQKIYRKGRKQLELNLQQTDDHIMHQWRKQVKYLWYQLVFLQPLWPRIIDSFATEFKELSKQLGNHHDLVVMLQALKELKQEGRMLQEIRMVERMCRSKKYRLEKTSVYAGKKLFLSQGQSLDHLIDSLYALSTGPDAFGK